MPYLVCLNMTGPGEVAFTTAAITKSIGEMSKIIIAAKIISSNLLKPC